MARKTIEQNIYDFTGKLTLWPLDILDIKYYHLYNFIQLDTCV